MDLSLKICDIPINRSLNLKGTISQEESPRLTEIVGCSDFNLDYEIEVNRNGDTLIFQGMVAGKLPVSCDLCLNKYEFVFSETIHQILIPEPDELQSSTEVLLEPEELETDFYSGEVIDLIEILEDHALLALPTRMICQATCLGLCPECGVDMNKDKCFCSEKIDLEHPFASLLPN